jgi:hypothetical protein
MDCGYLMNKKKGFHTLDSIPLFIQTPSVLLQSLLSDVVSMNLLRTKFIEGIINTLHV